MSIVGESAIRHELEDRALGRLRADNVVDLFEGAQPLRLVDVASPSQRSTTRQVKTLAEFYQLFYEVMDAARLNDGFEYRINHSKEFPPVETILPCFTTKLISRDPYSVNGRREIGPRYMEDVPDQDYPGDLVQQTIRRQSNVVRVTLWAKTSKVADLLADWVEDKFFEYLWVFQWAGIAHPIQWLGRESDVEIDANGQMIYGAPMTLKVITYKITQVRETALRSVAIKVGLLIDDQVRDVIKEDLLTP